MTKKPPDFLLTLVIFIVLTLLSEILKPKPKLENAKPNGLGDFNFPTATEGRVIPLIWGTVQMSGPNIVWYGDLRAYPIKQKVQTGLFSSKKVIIGYKYSVGVQFGLCQGPVDQLRKIWVGDELIEDFTAAPLTHGQTFLINKPSFFGGEDVGGNGGIVGTIQFFAGNTTQIPSTYLDDYQLIAGEAPAYRGLCYVAPTAAINLGNSTSIKPWKFECRRIPAASPTANVAHILVNSADANPAFVLYEIMTDTWWGLGIPAASIDELTFKDAAQVCFTEGNGFSMQLDQPQEASDLIRLLEQQVDGKVYQDQITGKWKLILIRPTADLPTAPAAPKTLDKSTILSLESFTRGAWDNTPNQVLLEFHDRSDEYKQTFAGAQDLGNIEIQQQQIRSQVTFPGVKDKVLANSLAWRLLLTLSYPLSKARVIANRHFWNAAIGDIVLLTDEDLGLVAFQMRVGSVNLGRLGEGEVALDLVEDIFRREVGAFADPPHTGWITPADTIAPFDHQLAFEAPRAFNRRAGDDVDDDDCRIWAGARVKGPEAAFEVHERHGATNPGAGAYAEVGTSYGFMLLGALKAAWTKSDPVPKTSAARLIKNTYDLAAVLLDALDLGLTKSQVGKQLENLLLIGNEFILVTAAQINTGELQLDTIYRGALDSVQEDHAIDDKVYILSAGGAISDSTLPDTDFEDVKLLPTGLTGTLPIASATDIEYQNAKRARRPYVPVSFTLAGVLLNYPATLSLEQAGSTDDNFGLAFAASRRDYRIWDEVSHMEADAATLASDFPAAQDHVLRVDVYKDPGGTPVLLFTDEEATLTSWVILRKKVLRFNAGAVPANLGLVVYSRHTDGGEVLDSRRSYVVNFALTSALTSLFNMGVHAAAAATPNPFVVATAGIHSALLVTALANNLEHRVNGGAWTNLITAGNTTGNTAALNIADTVEFRHSESAAGLIQIVKFRNPSVTNVAYSVLRV